MWQNDVLPHGCTTLSDLPRYSIATFNENLDEFLWATEMEMPAEPEDDDSLFCVSEDEGNATVIRSQTAHSPLVRQSSSRNRHIRNRHIRSSRKQL